MTAAERAYREAREQGLPERVEDAGVLSGVARLIMSASTAPAPEQSGGGEHAA